MLLLIGCQEDSTGTHADEPEAPDPGDVVEPPDLGDDSSRPTATIVSPTDGSLVAGGTSTVFEAEVGDAQDPPSLLSVEWTSSLDGAARLRRDLLDRPAGQLPVRG